MLRRSLHVFLSATLPSFPSKMTVVSSFVGYQQQCLEAVQSKPGCYNPTSTFAALRNSTASVFRYILQFSRIPRVLHSHVYPELSTELTAFFSRSDKAHPNQVLFQCSIPRILCFASPSGPCICSPGRRLLSFRNFFERVGCVMQGR